jgi:prepilin-type N-terminal cleavage/methylation domain-containing protein
MKSRGFTLLELLLTLSLFAVIMGLLMNVFFQFKDQTTRFDATLDLRQEARILEHLLRQDLQAAVYLKAFINQGKEVKDDRRSGIVGIDEQAGDHDRDWIHMHVNRPTRFFRGISPEKDPGIHEVSYYLEVDDNNRLQFNRREQFYIDLDITDGDEGIIHALSENVVGFDIKYYMKNNSDPVEEWGAPVAQQRVKGAFGVPAGVVVTLKLQTQGGEIFETQFQINLQPSMGGGISWD